MFVGGYRCRIGTTQNPSVYRHIVETRVAESSSDLRGNTLADFTVSPVPHGGIV